jgi:hypothetical protein
MEKRSYPLFEAEGHWANVVADIVGRGLGHEIVGNDVDGDDLFVVALRKSSVVEKGSEFLMSAYANVSTYIRPTIEHMSQMGLTAFGHTKMLVDGLEQLP